MINVIYKSAKELSSVLYYVLANDGSKIYFTIAKTSSELLRVYGHSCLQCKSSVHWSQLDESFSFSIENRSLNDILSLFNYDLFSI